jgi:hypothetical protein
MKKASQGPKQRTAFRENYLAAIFAVAALFLNLSTNAQTMPTRAQLQPINAAGYEWQTGSFKKGLYFPKDTLQSADSGAAAIVNGVLYLKNIVQGSNIYWGPLSGGSAHTDSFGIQDNVSSVDRYMNMKGNSFQIDSAGGIYLNATSGSNRSDLLVAPNGTFISNSDGTNQSTINVYPDRIDFPRGISTQAPKLVIYNSDSLKVSSPSSIAAFQNDTLKAISIADLSALVGGEANTVTNVGSGVGLAKAKMGVDIPLKSLKSTYGNTITGGTNEVDITSDTNTTTGIATRYALTRKSEIIAFTKVAYVDSAYGSDGTGQVDRPDKPFATINAALDATASLSKRVINIGVGTYASPDSSKIKSFTWFRGSGKPKPNWTVAVPSVDGDTKTAPTKLIGGTILQGSFWFNAYRLQGIIISDLGVDVGSAWCTANNSGNPAEGLLFATAYSPGNGTAADGGHFLQSGTTPLQGLVVRNVASLCQNATAAVHAALFENCFSPDISGVSTYFGTHGIVFKCIGGTASHLQAFGHSSDGIIVKSNDYANCYRLSISNFTIGSIDAYDGAGLLLDANDGGSPGLYFCNITNGTINRTTFGIRTQGSAIDGNNLSNIEVNVASGNGVDILTGFAFSSLQNIKARTCGGHGFNIASTQSGITVNDCDAHDNTGDGFRFTASVNANYDNLNAIYNDGYGINVTSGNVYGGISYKEGNALGAINGTVISKAEAQSLAQTTAIGATTSDAVSITGYSTSAKKFRVGDIAFQPYGLNNGFITDNAEFNGSAWTRFNTGYASKLQFYNGQIMMSNAPSGSGAPTFVQGFKTDFNGHVGLGGNIDDVTYSGAKVFINGGTGEVRISDSLRVNNTPTGNSSDSVLVKRNNVVYAVPQNTVGVQMLKGSTTWDPASISANSSTTTTITVSGAALGDPVTISKTSGSYSNGEVYFAYVSATNTVTIQLQNVSGGTFDISSATYNVIVLKY